jgi:hypothetical protein
MLLYSAVQTGKTSQDVFLAIKTELAGTIAVENFVQPKRFHKRRTVTATLILLVGLLLTYLFLPSDNLGSAFAGAAIGIGLSLAISTVIEGAADVRDLIRVDILMLWVLYSLTFLEFLFPQPYIENVLPPEVAIRAVVAAMLACRIISKLSRVTTTDRFP